MRAPRNWNRFNDVRSPTGSSLRWTREYRRGASKIIKSRTEEARAYKRWRRRATRRDVLSIPSRASSIAVRFCTGRGRGREKRVRTPEFQTTRRYRRPREAAVYPGSRRENTKGIYQRAGCGGTRGWHPGFPGSLCAASLTGQGREVSELSFDL